MKKLLLFFLFVLPAFTFLASQEAPKEKLKIFVESNWIDYNYIRNSTTFVDFVNDPKVCDVHIIVSRQSTGGGGFHYSFEYYGIEIPKIPELKLSCYTLSYDTDEIIRQKQVKTLHAGLLPFINEKSGGPELSVISNVERTNFDTDSIQGEANDPWKQWIFKIGADIGFDGEEKNLEYSFSFRAEKITDLWKISNQYDYERSEETIKKDNGGTIKAIRIEQDADVRFVFSLNPHWSFGVFLEGAQDTYRNIEMRLEAIPALQYNFFNWNESDRRQFTFSYYLGPTYNEYYQTTVFNKTNEWLWVQNIEIRLNRLETWGEINAWIQGGHFFPDFDNYFYEAGIDFGFRISKGISVYFQIQAESIHNQMYLPASELTDEELLLNTRKLPTTFEYSGRMGLRFQFGSIFNNVVNERL